MFTNKILRQCLLDQSQSVVVSLSCPSCHKSLVPSLSGPSSTNALLGAQVQRPQIPTRYVNEGGVQDNLDIFPLITEEAYLEAHPSARPARAYMTMCGEGDIVGIIELVQALQEDSSAEDDENSMPPNEILRCRDPLDRYNSALHVAIEKFQPDVAWLILWLASSLPTEEFPQDAVRAAQVLGASRETATAGLDVRSLKDEDGYTAGDLAERLGGSWSAIVGSGILKY